MYATVGKPRSDRFTNLFIYALLLSEGSHVQTSVAGPTSRAPQAGNPIKPRRLHLLETWLSWQRIQTDNNDTRMRQACSSYVSHRCGARLGWFAVYCIRQSGAKIITLTNSIFPTHRSNLTHVPIVRAACRAQVVSTGSCPVLKMSPLKNLHSPHTPDCCVAL